MEEKEKVLKIDHEDSLVLEIVSLKKEISRLNSVIETLREENYLKTLLLSKLDGGGDWRFDSKRRVFVRSSESDLSEGFDKSSRN